MNKLVLTGSVFPAGFQLPNIIGRESSALQYRYVEFYTVRIRNYNTRMAYYRALNQFFDWIAHHDHNLPLTQINPIMVATYLEVHRGSIPSRNQHLAAIRSLFNWLVQGGHLHQNPAQAVQRFKYSVFEVNEGL